MQHGHHPDTTMAIAAKVVERTDEEIEDAVRQRILAQAVKAQSIKAIGDGNNSKRKRRWAAGLLGVLLLIVAVIAISVTATRNNNSKSNIDDNRPMIIVAMQLDQFAVETGWNLTCVDDNNDVRANVVVPQGTYNVAFEYVESNPIHVEYGYQCQLRVTDEYGDGFCCRHGDGYYQVLLRQRAGEDSVLLLEESGEFGSNTLANFTVRAPEQVNGSNGNNSSASGNNNSTFAPLWMQVGQDVNGRTAGDKFGHAVSVATSSEDVIVAVGAPGLPSSNSAGYVKVQLFNNNTM